MFDKIKNYYAKKSKWNLVSDVFFVIFVALMLVPQTRQMVLPPLQRLFLFSPKAAASDEQESLSPNDWFWQVENATGGFVDLNDYKGKVIFINFWATWCPPCVAELPGIQALYDDYKDKVSFLLVSNEEFAVSGGFLAQKSYTLPLFKAIYTPPALMNTSSIPATFLIDKNGKLVIRKEGAADWNSNTVRKTIDALLQESSK